MKIFCYAVTGEDGSTSVGMCVAGNKTEANHFALAAFSREWGLNTFAVSFCSREVDLEVFHSLIEREVALA